MKRIFVLLIVVTMMVGILVSCAAPPPESELTPTPTALPKPTLQPTSTPEPTPTSRPSDMSYTTGQNFDGDYKPVMVVIENALAARPQTGLQTADVVYEVPVEGSITRFVCVFSDNVPEGVMPVRSGRAPFLYIQNEWDAAFMHYGGSGSGQSHPAKFTFYGDGLHDKIKIDIDGLKGKWSDYFKRVSSASTPHNVMGNPKLAQQLYDYEPQPLNWLFDSGVVYPGETVSSINLSFCSNEDDFVSYTYNTETGVYLRFMGGKKFVSAETKEQVHVKNVVVQYSTYSVDDSKYKTWKLTGGGKARFYIGGKMVEGTWERKTPEDKTMYYDNNGKQIVLLPGNTWIHICPDK